MCRPSDIKNREKIIKEMFGSVKGSFYITQPFYCDYGFNISIAPGCVFSTAGHAIDAKMRADGLEIALPITVGDDVWIRNITEKDKEKYPVWKE